MRPMLRAGLALVAAGVFATFALAQTPETSAPSPEQTPASQEATSPTPTDVAPAPETVTEQATAPSAPVAQGLTAPPEGKGQIVFFRPSRLGGAALTYTVRENEADLGRLANGRYFVQVAEPGIHEYQIGRNDTLRIEIEPGQTYYAQNNIAMGILAGRAVLAPTDQAAFERALARMRLAEPITPQQ